MSEQETKAQTDNVSSKQEEPEANKEDAAVYSATNRWNNISSDDSESDQEEQPEPKDVVNEPSSSK